MPRENEHIPKNTQISSNDLKEFDMEILVDYYESKIIFKSNEGIAIRKQLYEYPISIESETCKIEEEVLKNKLENKNYFTIKKKKLKKKKNKIYLKKNYCSIKIENTANLHNIFIEKRGNNRRNGFKKI